MPLADRIVIEAESAISSNRTRFSENRALVRGSGIIGRGFGGRASDRLDYEFFSPDSSANQSISIKYATAYNRAAFALELDGKPLQDLELPGSGDWLRFSRGDLYIGALGKGPHRLSVRSKAGAVNIDSFMIYDMSREPVIIEGEWPINQMRMNHVQRCPVASGGAILDNQFGSRKSDVAVYRFDVPADWTDVLGSVMYATELTGVECDLLVDGKAVSHVRLPRTAHWWNFRTVGVSIGSLGKGAHTIAIRPNGLNMNIDALFIQPWKRFKWTAEAENLTNPTREAHVQFDPYLRGGRIITNDFGASVNDHLSIPMDLEKDISGGTLYVSYATQASRALYTFEIDGTPIARLDLPATGGWWNYREASVRIRRIPKGIHTMRVSGNGINVNFDYFEIR